MRTASFDELGDNVLIAEQYAAQGIHFNVTAPFPISSKVCTRSFYARDCAFNPPNVAHANRCGIEFGYSGVLVAVDRSRMLAQAGLSVAAGSTGPVKLEASTTKRRPCRVRRGTAGPSASTTCSRASRRGHLLGGVLLRTMRTRHSSSTSSRPTRSSTPSLSPPPPQPDFQIEADSPNSLGLAPGGIATTYLTIRRLAGSTGRIGFSAENLPRGVTASFLPTRRPEATGSASG